MRPDEYDKLANKLLPFILSKVRQASRVTPAAIGGDMSATEILTAVLSLDGPGSLLDADTVDGSHASEFIFNSLLTTRGDLILRGAAAPERYGLVVPASPTINYLGVANGETDPTWKSASSNPGAAARLLQSNASGQLQLVGLITGYVRPAADSTTALQLQNAAGTPIVTVDTTNARVWIGAAPAVSATKFHVDADAPTTGTNLGNACVITLSDYATSRGYALYGDSRYSGTSAMTVTWIGTTTARASQAGFYGGTVLDGTNGASAAAIAGVLAQNLIRSGATVTNAAGIVIQPALQDVGSGSSATNVFGIYIKAPSGVSITNLYAFYSALNAGSWHLGNTTAPSTSPADAVQLYSADLAAGDAGLHVRSETGAIYKFGSYAVLPGGLRLPVATKGADYTLTSADNVVVFTATATATLPAATGSGQTYRIICRAGTLTVDPNGAETIKGSTTAVLAPGEDLLITDTLSGGWE